jgi:hypothetical protein
MTQAEGDVIHIRHLYALIAQTIDQSQCRQIPQYSLSVFVEASGRQLDGMTVTMGAND